ncbi:hypothetical protein Kkor_0384 [Kangiella koreensis DSM 16069]|uniref:Uncharacterized protein n=1 Tax=Kangiella koreensis (strain DSM 16069 / JCM 12317 / KCTC 12182 / SW-125) TaxID=523791 RepID=C7R822_KANKD|nr:hypothetical protein Kkor_0384 [Kangiella koreensis DSM 16069]
MIRLNLKYFPKHGVSPQQFFRSCVRHISQSFLQSLKTHQKSNANMKINELQDLAYCQDS